jgi:antitoxin HicB
MTVRLHHYPIFLRPGLPGEGVAWLAEVPDLPGCMSDGDTPDEAIRNVQDAITGVIACMREDGIVPPLPGSRDLLTGRHLLELEGHEVARIRESAAEEGMAPRDYARMALQRGMERWLFGPRAGCLRSEITELSKVVVHAAE